MQDPEKTTAIGLDQVRIQVNAALTVIEREERYLRATRPSITANRHRITMKISDGPRVHAREREQLHVTAAAFDPDESAIVQAWSMSSKEFDTIKDKAIAPALPAEKSLRLLPRGFIFDAFEETTYAPWWLLFCAWLPGAWFMWRTIPDTKPAAAYGLPLIGAFLIWPLLEYALHRWVFHMPVAWAQRWPRWVQGIVNVTRLLAHTVHHAHPMDHKRIITPLPMSLLLSFAVFPPLFALMRPHNAAGLSTGLILGYVQYDLTHYLLHCHGGGSNGDTLGWFVAWLPFASRLRQWWAELQRTHANHHYATHGASQSFGVAHPWTDELFGTEPRA